MEKIDFYSEEINSHITVPISECYKIRNRKNTQKGYSYEFAVKTITPDGHCIKKYMSRDSFEMLRCRMVQD